MSSSKPRPLFTIDPGWLFIIAGLATIALGTLVPAQRDLQTLRYQLDELQAKQRFSTDRMAAYSQFLDELEQDDEALYVRLAASQLNRRPEGDQPVILASRTAVPVTDWIDSSVRYSAPPARFWPDSTISRLSAGAGQLWLLAAGALAVFAGMLLNTAAPRRRIAVDGATLSRLGNGADETQDEAMAACMVEKDVMVINRQARRERQTSKSQAPTTAAKRNNTLELDVPVAVATAAASVAAARELRAPDSLFAQQTVEAPAIDLDDVDALADTHEMIDASDESEETWCGELEALDSVDVAEAEPVEAAREAAVDEDEDDDYYDDEEEDEDDEIDEDLEDEDWDEEEDEDDEDEEDDEEYEDDEEEDEDDADEEEWDEEDEEGDEEDLEDVELDEDEEDEEWEEEGDEEDDDEEYEDDDDR